ncbi:Magnesium chelatase [Planctomycetales bacterium 10988]|nr:Magnesium chelatase [Planctomycetales bacterium 10988]
MTEEVQSRLTELEEHMAKVVLGKPEIVRLCVIAVLAEGHVLLEDVPGVGKTLIGKALAHCIDGNFCRLQLTPDLLPSDIVGTSLYNNQTGDFTYKPGPLFANVVLADEINRTTPRTQSALLEAMSDRQISVDGVSHPLPDPFIVIATQNPFEFEGTYPLPESQLDRFLFRIKVGYPPREIEAQILKDHLNGEPVEELQPILSIEDLLSLRKGVHEVTIEESLEEYLLDIIHATRDSEALHVGISTRGLLAFFRAAQAMAFVEGRDYLIPDDFKRLAVPTLAHRVLPKGFHHTGQRESVETLIKRLVDAIPVPS